MIGKGRAVLAAMVGTSTVMPDQCGALWSEVTAVFRKFVKNPPLNLGTSDILPALYINSNVCRMMGKSIHWWNGGSDWWWKSSCFPSSHCHKPWSLCSAINDSSVALFVTFITSPFTLSWDILLSNHNLICHPENCLCVISHYFVLLNLFTVWHIFFIKYWSALFVSHPAVFPPVSVRLLTQ